ncbi:hypothetical protein GQ53DRAFT_784423 [Thozetella sp. PMI_491]|nr:hypothetical protein GQ53DRAFT_784423 [Thozetella sp. PMI_491]
MIDRESGDSDFDMHSDFEVVQIQDARLTDKEVNTLIKWLQPTDYNAESSEFRRHLLSRAPGTGAWLCETERYRAWYSSQQHGSLWIKGVPGAGKSGALHPLLGTALNQVSDNVLWECLLKGLADVPKVFCVADALDEMDNQGSTAFLRRLNSLATFRPERVKLFMTSRPRQDLQSALSAASIIHISLEEDKVGKEIEGLLNKRCAITRWKGPNQLLGLLAIPCSRF